MEESDVGIVRGLSLFEEAEEKVSRIPGARGEILKKKFTAVKNRNPDLQKIMEIRDQIVATRYMPDMRDFKTITHAPVHTADIERSFSIHKHFLTDKRTTFTKENVRRYVITRCYYRRSNPEPLGIWKPILQETNPLT